MGTSINFLGWNASPPELTTGKLFANTPGFHDGCGHMVVVPTSQAGRRLCQLAALRVPAGVLGLDVLVPGVLLQRFMQPSRPPADPSLVLAAWARLLRTVPLDRFPAFLGRSAAGPRDDDWFFATGRILQLARETLSEAGLTPGLLVERFGSSLEELARWQEIAQLESGFLRILEASGFSDPCRNRLEAASQPVLPTGLERVTVACIPDLSPLVCQLLENLAGRVEVEILVHAPADLAEGFDAWGRPLPAFWNSRLLDIPDEAACLLTESDPAAQASRVLRILEEAGDRFGWGPADTAIGVPDAGVIPPLRKAFEAQGIPVYDPAEQPLRSHPVCQLVLALLMLKAEDRYEHMRVLLRHPDLLAWLEKMVSASSSELLEQLDRFQNARLPTGLEDAARKAAEDWGRESFDLLRKLIPALRGLLDQLSGPSFADGLMQVLETVYAGVPSSRFTSPSELESAASRIRQALEELRQIPPELAENGVDSLVRIFRARLDQARYARQRDPGTVLDLDGWMELSWSDAPLLVVTGLNEGCVPEGRPSDPLVPEPLKSLVGLPDEPARFARDAFLAAGLLSAREEGRGRVFFLHGRFSLDGEPLRPSRLLFRVPDEALAERAGRLFEGKAPAALPPACRNTLTFLPVPPGAGLQKEKPDAFYVTEFRDYLACPFRYYLKKVLKMEELADSKTEPDHLDFGNLVHRAWEMFGTHGGDLRCSRDAREVADYLCTEAERAAEAQFGDRPGLSVSLTVDVALQRLRAGAEVQVELAREGWEILKCEEYAAMEFEVDGRTIRLSGKADRIDRHRSTGQLRIIDYKTFDTARGRTPVSEHIRSVGRREVPSYARFERGGKACCWKDLQLPLYVHLLRSVSGESADGLPSLAYFLLPKAVTDTQVVEWKDLSKDDLASAWACAVEIIRRVQDGVFWPPSERVDYEHFAGLLMGDPDQLFPGAAAVLSGSGRRA